MITALYHNPETDETIPFHLFDDDDLELVMPWVMDQFHDHDLEDHLVLETRHLQAFNYFLTRIDKSEYVGWLREFLTLAQFLKWNLGWGIHLELTSEGG